MGRSNVATMVAIYGGLSAVLLAQGVHAAPLLSTVVSGTAAQQPFSASKSAASGQIGASFSKSGTRASARAQFGKVSLDIATTQAQSSTRAQASWFDTLTVTAPGVTFGTLYVPVLIQISVHDQSKTGVGQTSAGQTFSFKDTASGRASTTNWSVSPAPRSLFTSTSSGIEPLAFTPGVAATLSETIFCATTAGSCKILRAGWGGITRVTDANGVAITNYSIQSASGTNYRTNFVPDPAAHAVRADTITVPEAGSTAGLLAGCGLLGLIELAGPRRRRRALSSA